MQAESRANSAKSQSILKPNVKRKSDASMESDLKSEEQQRKESRSQRHKRVNILLIFCDLSA
jgi:hypothetical protein